MTKSAAKAAQPSRVPTRLPSYRRPPVAEVVVGVVFDQPIPEFLVGHVGLFWHRLRDEFPYSQHFGPFIPTGGEPRWLDTVTGLPLPRVWFLSKSKHELIQLQGDCFFFNWRKLADGDVYPRFPKIISAYDKYLGQFLRFLEEQGFPAPKPMSCELTYTNYVVKGAGWDSMADISRIFKDFCWTQSDKRFLNMPTGISWTSAFDLPDKFGTLTAKLLQAARRTDATPILRLDLSAKGINEAKGLSELRPWFDVAHEWIVQGFTDLTTASAQKDLWAREDA